MKFRATLRDWRALYTVCDAAKGVGKRCIIKLSATRIRVIVTAAALDGGLQVWGSVPTNSIFGLFRIESKTDNDIFCDVPIRDLMASMRGAVGDKKERATVLKLSRLANRPVLCLSSPLRVGAGDLTHCVPVRVLSEEDAAQLCVPCVDDCVASFQAPPLEALASVLERLRLIGCTHVVWDVQPEGPEGRTVSLRVCGRGNNAQCATTFERLAVEASPSDSSQVGAGPVRRVGVTSAFAATFDVRRIVTFLSVRDARPQRVVVHCTSDRGIVVSAVCSDDITFVYCVPSLVGS
eukprot:PhM_4_TR12504/c0_g1_i1/m.65070/K10903/HUS1; HUS1 checkpoint protein